MGSITFAFRLVLRVLTLTDFVMSLAGVTAAAHLERDPTATDLDHQAAGL